MLYIKVYIKLARKGHENSIIFEGLLPPRLGALISENPALDHSSWAASGRLQNKQADK